MNALVIGGTGFIGRASIEEFRAHGYDVIAVARGVHDDLIAEDDVVSFRGDRNDRATLETLRDEFEPEVVVDLCGFYPRQVEMATDVFADADAYVFVSSASAYDTEQIRLPTREGDPLHQYAPDHADDDSIASYGPRKAECDRVCFRAAETGVNALIVRPACVYGPYDHSERHDYWFHRVNTYDRILVPGDGDSTFHRVYVDDVASALRIVAERGDPGEAYNAAERQTAWLDLTVELAANTLDTTVERVHASSRELAQVGLSPSDFPLYMPVPAVVASEKLAALGWESTPLEETFDRTIEEHLESGRTGSGSEIHDFGVDRETEEALIERLGS